MKAKILIFLIIVTLKAFAQEYIPIDSVRLNCTYWYEFQQDSTSKYSLKSQEMTLQIGERCSKFAATHSLFNDSVFMAQANEPPSEALSDKIWAMIGSGSNIIYSYCKHYIYKNYPENGMTTFTSYFNQKHMRVTENITFPWDLVHDADTVILGYHCRKATTRYAGRDYVAWFTTEIPVSDGPHKFCGLPGLIAKISDTQNQHRFELISVEKPKWKQPIIFKKNNFIEMTAKEYAEALNVNAARLFNRIQREEGLTIPDDESKARALHNVKTRNNFIERYK